MFIINFAFCSNCYCFASENSKKLEGHAQFYEYNDNEVKNIFTGETHKIKTRDVIKMTVSEVLSSGFSQEGDECFACWHSSTWNSKRNGGFKTFRS